MLKRLDIFKKYLKGKMTGEEQKIIGSFAAKNNIDSIKNAGVAKFLRFKLLNLFRRMAMAMLLALSLIRVAAIVARSTPSMP